METNQALMEIADGLLKEAKQSNEFHKGTIHEDAKYYVSNINNFLSLISAGGSFIELNGPQTDSYVHRIIYKEQMFTTVTKYKINQDNWN